MIQIKNRIPLDDILTKFSIWGRYHMLATLWIVLANASNSICYTNYILITDIVKYRCKEYESFDEGFNGTHVDNSEFGVCSNSSESCSEWVYEDPNSFVAEFDLACEEWKRTLVGTVHGFGYMVGLLVVGPLSDRFGRKTMVVTTGVLGGVCGLARSFTTNYWLYLAFEFLEALVGDPCSPVHTLNMEIVSTSQRVTYALIPGLGFVMGGLLYSLTFWLVPYWRHSLRILYTPSLFFIAYIYLLDESPRWLLNKGKKDEAVTVIKKIAKTNNQELDVDVNNVSYEEAKSAGFGKVIRETFKSKAMLTRFFVCSVWWITSTFVNHGLKIYSVSLQGNKHVNFALTAIVDIPANFVLTYVLIKFKRKMPLIMAFVAVAVLCIIQPFASAIQWLSITLYMAGKFLSSIYFRTSYIYTSELFPTYTRNSMHALCSSVGRIGSILAPQIPLLVVYWAGLPSLVFGIVSLAAGLLTCLVPDTAETSLPDTVDQAKDLGKSQESLKKKEPKDGTARF